MTALCAPWITGPDITNLRGVDAVADIDEAVLDQAALAASEVLYELTGRQFPGVCRATVRPAGLPQGWTVAQMALLYSGAVGGSYAGFGTGYWGWGRCWGGSHSECSDHRQIDLGLYPVGAIHAIVENGVTLDPSAYRVDNDRLLIRLDGGTWNMGQDLNAPNGSLGTWSVDLSYGEPIPAAAASACASLAIQTGLAFSGQPNDLPQRVTSVNRQGVSWVLLDPMTFLENGKTGLYDVDLFIKSVNPNGLRQRPRVISPDTTRGSRRVGGIVAG